MQWGKKCHERVGGASVAVLDTPVEIRWVYWFIFGYNWEKPCNFCDMHRFLLIVFMFKSAVTLHHFHHLQTISFSIDSLSLFLLIHPLFSPLYLDTLSLTLSLILDTLPCFLLWICSILFAEHWSKHWSKHHTSSELHLWPSQKHHLFLRHVAARCLFSLLLKLTSRQKTRELATVWTVWYCTQAPVDVFSPCFNH